NYRVTLAHVQAVSGLNSQRVVYRLFGTNPYSPVRTLSIATAVLLSSVVFNQRVEAQDITFSRLESYLDSFRVTAGIPGMSATVAKNGIILWEQRFGNST